MASWAALSRWLLRHPLQRLGAVVAVCAAMTATSEAGAASYDIGIVITNAEYDQDGGIPKPDRVRLRSSTMHPRSAARRKQESACALSRQASMTW